MKYLIVEEKYLPTEEQPERFFNNRSIELSKREMNKLFNMVCLSPEHKLQDKLKEILENE